MSLGVGSKKVLGDADGGSPRSSMVWRRIIVHEKRVERVKTTRQTSFLIVRDARGSEQGKKRILCVCVHRCSGRGVSGRGDLDSFNVGKKWKEA